MYPSAGINAAAVAAAAARHPVSEIILPFLFLFRSFNLYFIYNCEFPKFFSSLSIANFRSVTPLLRGLNDL